jgi:rhamnulokinase
MGLWLLQESLRAGNGPGSRPTCPPCWRRPPPRPTGGPQVDPDAPAFLPPGDMAARVQAACRRTGQPEPATRPELVRCILDSPATAFARAVADAGRLSGRRVEVVHLVGGGARNRLLCQLTADACGLPVLAGPVEATALGNVLVQARAAGRVGGDLEALRALVRQTQEVRRFRPTSQGRRW